MNVNLYVMTHKEFSCPNDPMYQPLHVGKMGKPDLGFLGDNIGESISDKNPYYCELTGHYWLWKNVKTSDHIGVCHYHKYFYNHETKGLLLENEIVKILQEYDVIVPWGMLLEQSIADHFSCYHDMKILSEVRKIIKEIQPEYMQAFDYVMNGRIFYGGNMLITTKNIFDEYCEWIFSILFTVEKRIDVSEMNEYQRRIFGFIGERLLRVWLVNHTYRIKEVGLLL